MHTERAKEGGREGKGGERQQGKSVFRSVLFAREIRSVTWMDDRVRQASFSFLIFFGFFFLVNFGGHLLTRKDTTISSHHAVCTVQPSTVSGQWSAVSCQRLAALSKVRYMHDYLSSCSSI